ncbi:Single-stranded DNA-binding protein, partial [Haemophilus influenzae]
ETGTGKLARPKRQ